MTYNQISLNQDDTWAEIVLNNPAKRNPLSVDTMAELTDALQTIAAGRSKAVVLKSTGPVFCSGHNFHDMAGQDLAHLRQLMQACSDMMQRIHQLPQPVIASVQGPAIGAGCQLALTCDLVVASDQASFRTPGNQGGWFCLTPMVAVTRAVGRKRALEMLLAGDPIPAELAAEWGMVNRVVPPERLEAETEDLLARISRGSRYMVGIGKQAFYTQVELDEARAYQYATELMAATGSMPDPQERMLAFVEKRPRRAIQS